MKSIDLSMIIISIILLSKTIQRLSPRSLTGIWTGLLTVKIMWAVLQIDT